jgi:hypothetical protein
MIAAALVALLLGAQAAPPADPKPGETFSILADPVPDCPKYANDIVVCARSNQEQRLPLPDDRWPPDGPIPSNRYVTGTGALAAEGKPCGASMKGCTVGFGPPVMPIAKALVDTAKDVFAKKPDKTGRVPIPLDDPTPPPGQHVFP